jgi:hypothetical protein
MENLSIVLVTDVVPQPFSPSCHSNANRRVDCCTANVQLLDRRAARHHDQCSVGCVCFRLFQYKDGSQPATHTGGSGSSCSRETILLTPLLTRVSLKRIQANRQAHGAHSTEPHLLGPNPSIKTPALRHLQGRCLAIHLMPWRLSSSNWYSPSSRVYLRVGDVSPSYPLSSRLTPLRVHKTASTSAQSRSVPQTHRRATDLRAAGKSMRPVSPPS